jgi:hypothetical protein
MVYPLHVIIPRHPYQLVVRSPRLPSPRYLDIHAYNFWPVLKSHKRLYLMKITTSTYLTITPLTKLSSKEGSRSCRNTSYHESSIRITFYANGIYETRPARVCHPRGPLDRLSLPIPTVQGSPRSEHMKTQGIQKSFWKVHPFVLKFQQTSVARVLPGSVPNCSILRHHGYPPSIPFPWGNCAIRIGPIPALKNWKPEHCL